jgi:dolichol-phosphate mannosyltransferase
MRLQLLSIVIPCFNEEQVIHETIKRLAAVSSALEDIDVEMIFVDDGSTDDTRELIKSHIAADPRIRLIGLARNFGHQIAVTAGIDAARGDAVVLIDADLQDPPELICEMVEIWRGGFDVIYGQRTERTGESAFKVASARWFYRILNRLSDIDIPLDVGDFRLMSREVADCLRSMPERDRFIRGMVTWIGFNQTSLPYKREKRFAGTSKYPLSKMLKLAADGVISFSTRPLQISIGLGIATSFISLAGILYVLFLRLFTDTWAPGWTTMMLAILFIGGIQMVLIGIIGEYLGRIYKEIKGRPLYIASEYVGFSDSDVKFSRSPVLEKK